MQVVSLILYDGMRTFDYAVVAEVWRDSRIPRSELRLCSLRRRAVVADGGARINATRGLVGLSDADLVIVPGGAHDRSEPASLLSALQAAHRDGTAIAALGDGALTLARAGLLRDRQATTSWSATGELLRRFPEVNLKRNARLVEDSGIWTSAGATAGIDLCLRLVREAHGAEAADVLAHQMAAAPRCCDEPAAPDSTRRGDVIAETIAWALDHLHEPITIRRLADRARMSERTFARRFVRITAVTPLRWLHRERSRRARHLLETTDLPVESIAQRTGFGSASALRRHFGRELGTTPSTYRRWMLGPDSVVMAQ